MSDAKCDQENRVTDAVAKAQLEVYRLTNVKIIGVSLSFNDFRRIAIERCETCGHCPFTGTAFILEGPLGPMTVSTP